MGIMERREWQRRALSPLGVATVLEGGQLSITAGGMTEGNGTCGQASEREKASPRGANHS